MTADEPSGGLEDRRSPDADPRDGRVRHLLVARLCEQGAYGLASLLLARRLGIDAYAPVALLFVFDSLAVLSSDFGLGMAVLRTKLGQVNHLMMRRVRLANTGVFLVSGGLAVALTGSSRTIAAAFALIWGLSAEAFVRKAALIRLGRLRRVAIIEVAGSSAFGVLVVVALAWPREAVVVASVAFVTKHVLESALSGGWRQAFGSQPQGSPILALWLSQLLAYGSANVDYLLVGVLISAAAFSVYSLSFRIAALVTSQVSYAVQRVMLVDFGDGAGVTDRQRRYDDRSRQLFLVGLVAGAVTAGVAPLFPIVLGHSWDPVVMVVVVLAVAVPWRMVLGVAGTLTIGAGHSRRLSAWEAGRLAFTTALLGAGALIGFPAFVACSTITAVLATDAMHRLAARRVGVHAWRPMLWASAVAVPAALGGALFVTTPH